MSTAIWVAMSRYFCEMARVCAARSYHSPALNSFMSRKSRFSSASCCCSCAIAMRCVGGVDLCIRLVHLCLGDWHVRGGGVDVALEPVGLHVVGDLAPLVRELLQHDVARLVVRVVIAVARIGELHLVVVTDGGRARPRLQLVVLRELVTHACEVLPAATSALSSWVAA